MKQCGNSAYSGTCKLWGRGRCCCVRVTEILYSARNSTWKSQTAPTRPFVARSRPLRPRPTYEPPPLPSLWPAWALLMMATRLCSACLATGLLLEALLVAPRPGCPVEPPKVRRLQELTTCQTRLEVDLGIEKRRSFQKLKAASFLPSYTRIAAPHPILPSQGLVYPRAAKKQSAPGVLISCLSVPV